MANRPLPPLRSALSWAELWPSLRAGLAVLVLFAGGVWLARVYAVPLQAALAEHALLGAVVFFASAVVAVLMPMLTNLPLLPVAVLAWGPAWTAALLLSGWIVGAAIAFALGRHARAQILKRLPSVQRHAGIDRLVHPRHRLASLVLLRMSFPVDVLSYALGMFSSQTTAAQNATSTALGAAPFAVLFSLFPTLSATAQWAVFGGSTLVFLAYLGWVLPQAAGRRSGSGR